MNELASKDIQLIAIVTVMVVFALAEALHGKLFPREATPQDNRLDIAVTMLFPLISGTVLFTSQALCAVWLPSWHNALADWAWWQLLLLLLVADDLTQYFWHRLSHTSVMWPLHRAHHSAAYMSVRVVYRNNAFYYALMPGIWLSGVLLHAGIGWVYVGYTIVKLSVIISAHSALAWDRWLYKRPALRPLAWVLARLISTPSTHHAHHALTQDDGIGWYTGNYGNLLFIWDVLFGTAHITGRFPPAYGLPDDRRHGPEHWAVQFVFPLLRSQRAETVLGRGAHAPTEGHTTYHNTTTRRSE
jgi:hypothetical protein